MSEGKGTSHPSVDSATGAVAFTDYYPFGFAMPGRQYLTGSPYRFGYQGQFAEKDEETGLNHFSLRLYDSRIGRWNSTDPYNQYWSHYLGMGNNPIFYVDPDGGATDGYTNGCHYIWLDGVTAPAVKINGETYRHYTSDRAEFNFWSGGDNSFNMLAGITIIGKMGRDARLRNNPIAIAVNKAQNDAGNFLGRSLVYAAAAKFAPVAFGAEFASQMFLNKGDISNSINNINLVNMIDKTGLTGSFINVSGSKGVELIEAKPAGVNLLINTLSGGRFKAMDNLLKSANAPALMLKGTEALGIFSASIVTGAVHNKYYKD